MAHNQPVDERTHLLSDRSLEEIQPHDEDPESLASSSAVTKEEQQLMPSSAVGERLPYNDYTTIDWLHDLVKESYRYRTIHSRKGLRYAAVAAFDACSGWIAAAIIGTLTACAAFVVDVVEATVSDWKIGYCTGNPLLSKENCCKSTTNAPEASLASDACPDFRQWSTGYWSSFSIYAGWALAFGIVSCSATMLTRRSLPAVTEDKTDSYDSKPAATGKVMYMAAGSGIPEIKTILSGFVIPNFLDLKVLVVKGFGAIFAVATGMCLGKEGPFVHMSTCVGYLVAMWFPKYAGNGRKLRELLSAACASGLSVAFGAPIGGVLFSYEEISTYFPRKVLWRAFLCSLVAAVVLKALNPTGTGKLVLFETNYGTSYRASHYVVFVILGVAGGVWGGLFCKANFVWSRWFRSYGIIKKHPVLEVFLVVLVTSLLQYPNPLIREPGDVVIKDLLVDCRNERSANTFVCTHEARDDGRARYIGWLLYGTVVKLVLTIITFGCKVPSGVIIPALDAGALFGRLVGQTISTTSPGIFAMVGAAAFLAGVSRMTISLCVIMFELTGELEYTVPHMIAILVAKWTADAISADGVYDLAQTVLGHPFLDADHALKLVQKGNFEPPSHQNPSTSSSWTGDGVEEQQLTPLSHHPHPHPTASLLLPPPATMSAITVTVPPSHTVPRALLAHKLGQLRARGLMDAGLVFVHEASGVLAGYVAQAELEWALDTLGKGEREIIEEEEEEHVLDDRSRANPSRPGNRRETGEAMVRVLPNTSNHLDATTRHHPCSIDLAPFVDLTPLALSATAPLEYAVELFAKLGLRYLCLVDTQGGTGRLLGVVIKKRVLGVLEGVGK
ncbi:chloride channel [Phyllosticta capitalensis]